MWCHYVVAIFFLAYLVNVLVHGNSDHPLHQRLNSWHTLKEEDIYVHRHKRSLSNDDVVVPLDKQVNIFIVYFGEVALLQSTQLILKHNFGKKDLSEFSLSF